MFRWNLSTKVVAAYSGLIALMAGVLTTTLYWQFRSANHQAINDRLSDLLSLTAPEIDSDYHSLTLTPKDRNKPYYKINLKKLQIVQANSKDINRIYTLRPNSNGELTFVLNFAPKSKQSISVGEIVQNLTPILAAEASSLSETKIENGFLQSPEGKPVLYGYAPIKDQFGRLEGILAIELDASSIVQTELIGGAIALGTFLIILAFTVVIVSWLARSLIVNRTLRLNDAAKKLADGDWHQSLVTESEDELGELAKSFNYMAQQLQNSFKKLEEYSQTLEQKVKERTYELAEAKQIADNANQAKSDFLANMSHELRTPLNGILGYAQILGRTKALPEKERHGINIIHQCGSHLLTLINDVLDLSKIEARKLELTSQAIHLPSFLQGVVEICRVRSDQKGIDFIYEPDPNLPSGIETDEKRLRQVLLNLLGNAIKFTDKGSITLKVEVIELNVSMSVSQIKFQVIDTGVGIASDQVNKVFQAFEQVGDRKRQSEGTGLGLAISQRIVELMGGKIQVESHLGIGSNFYFEVAPPIATDWAQKSSVNQGRTIIGYEGPPRHILIVDDRWENRSVVVNLLEPIGFIFTEAENGKEGLEKAREKLPDLVITDLIMPVMDGFELLKQLRKSEDIKHLRVIVSSASVSQIDQQKSLDVGGDDFLTKPIDAEELLTLVAKHLQLTWKYDATELSTSDNAVSTKDLIPPSVTDLQILLELAQDGLLRELVETAGKIGEKDERYQPFIQEVMQLAKQFQTEKIEKLIEEHITNT